MSENISSVNTAPRPETTLKRGDDSPTKLASYMVANIVMLVVVCGASILLLLFGDFDGKVVRTITTLILFGLFTLFAGMDSSRDKPQRYVTISQIGHLYMLGMGLVLIWGSLAAHPFAIAEFSIPMKTLLIVGLVKIGVLVVQRVSDLVYSPQPQLSLAAKFCAGSLAGVTVLYTLPIGMDYFVNFGEGYWKFAVAVLLFAGLSISVTALLSWYVTNNQPRSAVRRTTVPRSSESPRASSAETTRFFDGDYEDEYAMAPKADNTKAFDLDEELKAEPQPAVRVPAPSPAPVTAPQPAAAAPSQAEPPRYAPQRQAGSYQQAPTVYTRPVGGPQPWPVFPNGQPLPATQNGRPDFAVLQYMASVHVEAERQWFEDGGTTNH